MIMIADLARYLAVAAFAAGVGIMLVTNVIAFRVLRPAKKSGFLWWHVAAISLSFLLLGSVAVDRIFDRLSQPVSWHTFATFAGITLFLVAQVIIFLIERSRLTAKKALEKEGIGSMVFDPATRTAAPDPAGGISDGGAGCVD